MNDCEWLHGTVKTLESNRVQYCKANSYNSEEEVTMPKVPFGNMEMCGAAYRSLLSFVSQKVQGCILKLGSGTGGQDECCS
jgi:hypothetical protein